MESVAPVAMSRAISRSDLDWSDVPSEVQEGICRLALDRSFESGDEMIVAVEVRPCVYRIEVCFRQEVVELLEGSTFFGTAASRCAPVLREGPSRDGVYVFVSWPGGFRFGEIALTPFNRFSALNARGGDA